MQTPWQCPGRLWTPALLPYSPTLPRSLHHACSGSELSETLLIKGASETSQQKGIGKEEESKCSKHPLGAGWKYQLQAW